MDMQVIGQWRHLLLPFLTFEQIMRYIMERQWELEEMKMQGR